MTKPYIMTEVKPRIFYLDFKDQYDCNMHFLRYQEHYESPSPKFRGKSFALVDFMEWYSKNQSKHKCFSYAIDWAGFNIPGYIIPNVHTMRIPDFNRYDKEMFNAWSLCKARYPDDMFYIIGGVGHGVVMKHEIAHGFFFTDKTYRKKMTALVKALKPNFRKQMFSDLKDIGYTPKVYNDECQAFMSTGLTGHFKVKLKKEHEPFVKLFNEYYNAKSTISNQPISFSRL